MLVQCHECRGTISTEAHACPHCGAVPGSAAKACATEPRRSSVVASIGRIIGLVVLIIGIVVVWKMVQAALQMIGVASSPKWIVEAAGGDDSCTKAGDYCMRAKCLVRNVGSGAGSVDVWAALEDQGGRRFDRRTTLRLSPGQSETATFDFFEAELGRHYRYGCRIDAIRPWEILPGRGSALGRARTSS